MSEYTWDDEDSNEQQGPQGLRDHAKKLEKALKDLTAKFEAEAAKTAELTKSLSAKSLDDLTRDLPPNVAKYLKKDLGNQEPTKELIDGWLKDNAADFGYTPGAKTEAPAAEADAAAVVEESAEPDVFDADYASALRGTQSLDTGKGQASQGSQLLNDFLLKLDKSDLSIDETLAELRKSGLNVTGTV